MSEITSMPSEKPLKILYIITKSNLGGAQRYVFDLATNLTKDVYEPTVAFGGNGPLQASLEAAKIPTISIPELERDIGILKEFRALISIFRVIKKIKPDIVHLNSSKVGLLGGLAVRFYNTVTGLQLLVSRFKSLIFRSPLATDNYKLKTVFTAHGWPFKEKRKFLFRKLLEYASWLTITLSDKTIVVSQDDMDKVSRFLFVKSKIALVHNGIEMPSFKERTQARYALADKIGFRPKDDKLWIGSIAELTKNKGLDYAVEAIKNVPDCLYTIIGGGEDKEKLKKSIEDSALDKKVFFTGQIDNAASLLKAFDIFLLPSLKEGLPYVLLEAGAAGLSVVATNVGGVPEIIEDMKSGIVIKEKRPKEIAEALTFLIDHPEKRKEFGDRLAKTVAEKFTLERMLAETINVYKNN